MNDKKLDLIQQLLSKAESTTPEEAEALTEAASKLMIKYGIEQAVLDERRARSGGAQEKIVEIQCPFGGVYALDMQEIGAAAAFGLGTIKPLASKSLDGKRVLHLVGFESDVKQAALLVSSLELQAMVAMRDWWAKNRGAFHGSTESAKRNSRSGFLRGFGGGVRQRLESNRATVLQEAGTGTDLVLASRLDRVKAFVGERPNARKRPNADRWAASNGYAAGLEANTGERAMTNAEATEAIAC